MSRRIYKEITGIRFILPMLVVLTMGILACSGTSEVDDLASPTPSPQQPGTSQQTPLPTPVPAATPVTVVPTLTATTAPTSSPTPDPTATPTRVPTSTPQPSPTATVVTATPTRQPSPTPTPGVALIPVASGPQFVEVTASVRSDNALIVELDLELDDAAKVYVEYENTDAGRFRTVTTPDSAMNHTVPIIRLRAESNYDYEVFALDGDGEITGRATGNFRTGTLPEAIASVEFEITGKPTYELTMFDLNLNEALEEKNGRIIVLDNEGHVVWYFNRAEGNIRAIKQKPNTDLVFLEGGVGVREITLLGEDVVMLDQSEESGNAHHDFLLEGNDRIIYISNISTRLTADKIPEGANISANDRIVGLAIREWDQSANQTTVLWNMFDFIPPEELASILNETVNLTQTAAHPNSLWVGPRGNTVVSFRYPNLVISIAPDYQSVEWRLGGPASDFEFTDPTDKFYHQHTAIELENGNILVFDNGNLRPDEEGGQYSRGLELELDFDNMTASKVWEFRHAPDIFARAISSTYRLENGNTLINFGQSLDNETVPHAIVEVSPDAEEVWKIAIPLPEASRVYRAYAYDSLSGETRLR